MEKPELVLPAGSIAHLKAAIANGADAVYLGAKRFSARATAENFDEKGLIEAVKLCHANGKKAYLAINTLIKDSEIDEAISLAKDAYLAGIDAAIVQDLGLISALRELIPDLPLHASTQMTCHNRQGAEFLASLGMRRIVLSRELSMREVKEIADALKPLGVGVECFVHGALCFSFSGQCLFSSFAFNKSGNRGRCLQPCRMRYELYPAMESGEAARGKKNRLEGKKGFILSMKDLMTIESVPELITAGISAFKVEGRLKGPDYVAAVGRAYRKAIDSHFGEGRGPSREDIKLMRMAFAREITRGYLFWDGDMVSPESPAPQGLAAGIYLGEENRGLRIKLLEALKVGDRLSVVRGDSTYVFEVGTIISKTRKTKSAPAGWVVIVRTRNAPFLDKNQRIYFAPGGRVEEAAGLAEAKGFKDGLVDGRSAGFDVKKFEAGKKGLLSGIGEVKKAPKEECAHETVAFIDESQLSDDLVRRLPETVVCYSESAKQGAYFKRKLAGRDVKVKTPNVQTSAELDEYETAIKAGLNGMVCSNLGALQACIKNKASFWADRELNLFNSLAARLVLKLGAEKVIPSAECSLRQVAGMIAATGSAGEAAKGGERILPLAFFYPLLMTSRAYAKSSEIQPGEYTLVDRMGFRYKTVFDERRLLRIYNPLPVDMVPEIEKLGGAAGIDLRGLSVADAMKVLESLKEKTLGMPVKRAFKAFTRGHYERDVE